MKTNNQTKFKETEIGTIPEEWVFESLEKHADIIMGQSPESIFYNSGGEGLSFLQGIRTFGEKYPTFDTWTTKVTKLAKEGSVLLSVRAPVGEVNITGRDICIGRGLMAINAKNNEFIYQLFKTFKSYVVGKETGTVYGSVTRDDVAKLKLPFPPEQEQKQIAEILSSLDDKIELNRQINANLEKIASSLFKHWFVDFEFSDKNGKPYKSSGGKMIDSELGEIPEGWKASVLSELVNNISERYDGDNINDKFSYVPIDMISAQSLSLVSVADSGEAKSSLIKFYKDDILFGAMRPYFHKVSIAPFEGLTRTTCFVFRPKNKFTFAYSVMLIFQNDTIDFASSNSEGSTIPYAKWNNSMANMPIVIPSDEILKLFNETIYSLLEKIRDSYFENNSLVEIRDYLLPRLMSGKIRVKT